MEGGGFLRGAVREEVALAVFAMRSLSKIAFSCVCQAKPSTNRCRCDEARDHLETRLREGARLPAN